VEKNDRYRALRMRNICIRLVININLMLITLEDRKYQYFKNVFLV